MSHSLRIDFDTFPYWEGCRHKKLLILRCLDCGFWIHPPLAVCSSCWSEKIEAQEVSGKAGVYSFTVTPLPERASSFVTVWAELREQERLIVIGQLIGANSANIEIGDPLVLDWVGLGDHFVPAFRMTNR